MTGFYVECNTELKWVNLIKATIANNQNTYTDRDHDKELYKTL